MKSRVDTCSQSLVAVQVIHSRKVCLSHSNNDERHGQPRCSDDGCLSVSHVGQRTIRQHQQDEIVLQESHKRERERCVHEVPSTTHCIITLYLFEWTPWLQLFSGPERCSVFSRVATVWLLPSLSAAITLGSSIYSNKYSNCNFSAHLCIGVLVSLLCKPGHVVDNGGCIGGSPQLNIGECKSVSIQHSLDA